MGRALGKNEQCETGENGLGSNKNRQRSEMKS